MTGQQAGPAAVTPGDCALSVDVGPTVRPVDFVMSRQGSITRATGTGVKRPARVSRCMDLTIPRGLVADPLQQGDQDDELGDVERVVQGARVKPALTELVRYVLDRGDDGVQLEDHRGHVRPTTVSSDRREPLPSDRRRRSTPGWRGNNPNPYPGRCDPLSRARRVVQSQAGDRRTD